jgi:hypothetical protein
MMRHIQRLFLILIAKDEWPENALIGILFSCSLAILDAICKGLLKTIIAVEQGKLGDYTSPTRHLVMCCKGFPY